MTSYSTLAMPISLLLTIIIYPARSPFRLPDPQQPKIITYWQHDASQKFQLSDSLLRYGPFFKTYDAAYLATKLLPRGKITYRNQPDQTVSGALLSAKIENFLRELRQQQTIPKLRRRYNFSDFKILKRDGFNFNSFSGLLIAKFKSYPFVLKLMIENPASCTNPYNKGIASAGILVLGGTTRHILGLTRIKNSERVQEKIQHDPYWSQRITVPRKWFWLPAKANVIIIEGYNFCHPGRITGQLPAIYGVVAEEIVAQTTKPNPRECLALCNYLQCITDPNYSNHRLEAATDKLAIIDTEHFLLLSGTSELAAFKTYKGFYCRMGGRFIRSKLFRTKASRQKLQMHVITV